MKQLIKLHGILHVPKQLISTLILYYEVAALQIKTSDENEDNCPSSGDTDVILFSTIIILSLRKPCHRIKDKCHHYRKEKEKAE